MVYWFDSFDGLKISDYDQDGNETVVLDANDEESKKIFVSKIVSITQEGDLIRGQNYGTSCTITITLDDGRVL